MTRKSFSAFARCCDFNPESKSIAGMGLDGKFRRHRHGALGTWGKYPIATGRFAGLFYRA
jgi:hypothetical protein